ncbi:MAG: trypsin-like serine protease [Sandaracinaceae bacterium]|nr:trypsin-like serine protease [Sandaracinaceae bacterium]
MRNFAVAFFALILPSCMDAMDARDTNAARGAIIGGVETTDFPATVALMASDHTFRGQVFCTGTLIARRTVLSAAHCMDPTFVMFGHDPEAEGARFVPVAEFVRNPDYLEMDVEGIEHDVALAILAEDAPSDVPVIEIASVIPSNGTNVRWVGFGYTSYGGTDKGIKRTVEHPISSNLGRLVGTVNASCRADSGGSIYMMEGGALKLAGSNRGSLSMCEGDSFFVPSQLYVDWFNTTIDEHGGRGGPVTETDGGMSATDAGQSGDGGAPADVDGGAAWGDGGVTEPMGVRSSGCSISGVNGAGTSGYLALLLAGAGSIAFARASTRTRTRRRH